MASADNLRITVTVDAADMLRIESASRRVVRWRRVSVVMDAILALLIIGWWVSR